MANDYEARLEAKRKDDERRWRELQYQLSVGSPMGQTNKPIEAMQMLGQISGAGGTKPAADPFPSWLNAPAAAAPRPLLTPEQKAAQSRIYASAGGPTGRGGGGEGDDERKRLEAMLGAYKGKAVLSPQEEAEVKALKEKWYKLSSMAMPEGLSGNEEVSKWYNPLTWKMFKGNKEPASFSSEDKQAYDWAIANPKDSRSVAILKRLGK